MKKYKGNISLSRNRNIKQKDISSNVKNFAFRFGFEKYKIRKR